MIYDLTCVKGDAIINALYLQHGLILGGSLNALVCQATDTSESDSDDPSQLGDGKSHGKSGLN